MSAVVVGGGFYGACIAEHLAKRGIEVTLIERESQLMARASYRNQARLHGGYHYPRSFGTAYRSRLNFPRFVEEFSEAIVRDFTKLYAIARVGSKVNARQFEAFCRNIGAPLRLARAPFARLFSSHLVEAVYETEEYVFDAAKLASMMRTRLERSGVAIHCNERVSDISEAASNRWEVATSRGTAHSADLLVNCTYSGINTLAGLPTTQNKIKHEITEMALVELPEDLTGISVTVMDGPFFSFMPFPDRQLSTLSHVRYTPHAEWYEQTDGIMDPYRTLEEFPKTSRYPHMLRDAQRYLPSLSRAQYRDSLFEIKTVLLKNESDDGRPILFETRQGMPNACWVLGSKIDNVYDALVALDDYLGDLPPPKQRASCS